MDLLTHLRRPAAGTAWAAFMARLEASGLNTAVPYRNSRGETFTCTVADIVTHVSAHGEHHRGPIAAALRAAGRGPALTDHIQAVRSGAIG